jgi:RecB family exonuclease
MITVSVYRPFVKPVLFPKYHLLDDVILIGNTDYVGLTEEGKLQIIDFKTGIRDEDTPLQLYIYAILCEANLGKEVHSVSFWYLDRDSKPQRCSFGSTRKHHCLAAIGGG